MKCALVGYGYWGRNVLQSLLTSLVESQNLATNSSQDLARIQPTPQPPTPQQPATPPQLAQTKPPATPPLSKLLAQPQPQKLLAPYTSTPLTPASFEVVGIYDSDPAQANAALQDYARFYAQAESTPKPATSGTPRITPKISPKTTPKIYLDFDALCADKEIEAVFLITPPHTHYALAMQALESSKHCFVEKPLATSHAQCAALQKRAQDCGVVLHCDHIFLYSPAVQWLRAYISELGEIVHIQARRASLGRFQRGVSVVWDLALHDVAILDFVLESGLRGARFSKAQVAQLQGYHAIADITGQIGQVSECLESSALTTAATHAPITIHASWLSPIKTRQLLISGTKASALYDEMSHDSKLTIFPYASDLQELHDMGAPSAHKPALDSSLSPLQASIADFALQIAQGKARKELGEHTLRVIKTLEQTSRI